MTGSDHIARQLRISGTVQGVSYRAWTRQQARALELSGWVRNRTDGSVEAYICGPENAVQQLIDLCHDGPPAAKVEKIQTKEAEIENWMGFEIKSTA